MTDQCYCVKTFNLNLIMTSAYVVTGIHTIEQWYFFFKLATNVYHDDQQLLLLGERILRCLCGLPLFDLNPRSSALKINVLTIGPPRITIIIKSKVNIVFKKNEQWIVVWCLYNCVILAYCRHETIFCIRFSIYQI